MKSPFKCTSAIIWNLYIKQARVVYCVHVKNAPLKEKLKKQLISSTSFHNDQSGTKKINSYSAHLTFPIHLCIKEEGKKL